MSAYAKMPEDFKCSGGYHDTARMKHCDYNAHLMPLSPWQIRCRWLNYEAETMLKN